MICKETAYVWGTAAFYLAVYAYAKKNVKVPMRKENGKMVELDYKARMFYIQMVCSNLY